MPRSFFECIESCLLYMCIVRSCPFCGVLRGGTVRAGLFERRSGGRSGSRNAYESYTTPSGDGYRSGARSEGTRRLAESVVKGSGQNEAARQEKPDGAWIGGRMSSSVDKFCSNTLRASRTEAVWCVAISGMMMRVCRTRSKRGRAHTPNAVSPEYRIACSSRPTAQFSLLPR